MAKKTIEVAGPFFEDFEHEQLMEQAPSLTISSGYAVMYQSLFGDRLRLPLDRELCKKILGSEATLVNPHLLYNLVTGQTTYASQNVKGNLFYRGLVFKKPVFIGDTLNTNTKVRALRQNRHKEGRPATGMVVLEIQVVNQFQEEVMFFWRCPMIPCRDPNADTGHADSFDSIPSEINLEAVKKMIPSHWKLDRFQQDCSGDHFAQIAEETIYKIAARDTVTSAPELVRMTLNMATTHTDAGASTYKRRLVYGGHTISVAAAQIVRALPNTVTVMAWKACSHTAPVFEGDILRTEMSVGKKHALEKNGGLVELHAEVYANREEETDEVKVLDWELIVLMA
ncbi:MAG: acyl dehydratase [SAR324 cluster bacterium]|nr:acyl dehydratase [SAR324 cluster bacterium]